VRLGERVVASNASFVALVPFWAVWPFEVMVLPVRHVSELAEMTPGERDDLAAILKSLTSTYDKVFDAPFPYSMGLHPQPYDSVEHPEWHFHVHFYPPLLRSATVRKFMVGFELLGSPQRDITPESAADTLRTAAKK
jgi:UDPglucose--hexose-1-phosphate uridylyltransferase